MVQRDEQARTLEAIAEEFEAAAAHCRVAATHLVEGKIPRYGAHCWAAYGHASRGSERLTEQSQAFADRAVPVATDEA